MRLTRLIGLLAWAAAAAILAGTASAHSPRGTATYFTLRPDPRLCPSPICGGWWARRVNLADTICGDGTLAAQCYAASLDLSALALTDERRTTIERDLARGTALVRGRLVREPSGGPPPLKSLDTFVVTEVWLHEGAAAARGSVFRTEDNGIRCVRAPCFSLHVSELNTAWHRNVSDLDLAPARAARGSVRRARAALGDPGGLARGSIEAAGNGGRAPRATAFWLRAA